MGDKCKRCSFSDYETIKTETVDRVKYTYGICKQCGLVQQTRVYDRCHYHSLPCSFPTDYGSHAVRRADYIIDFLQPKLFHGAKILDIGCGPGKVMTEFNNRGYDASGYTIGDTSNYRISKRDVETDCLGDEKFDVLMFTHVVEHFLDPINTLRRCRQLLYTTGIVYVEVPSFHWAEVRIPTVFTPEHLSYFTPDTLTDVVQASGYNVIKLKESRYWGNIKAILQPASVTPTDTDRDYKKSLQQYKLVKWKYPIYNLIRKFKKIKPND